MGDVAFHGQCLLRASCQRGRQLLPNVCMECYSISFVLDCFHGGNLTLTVLLPGLVRIQGPVVFALTEQSLGLITCPMVPLVRSLLMN